MHTLKRDLVVIGGGPAGLAAAIAAKEAGCSDVLLIERGGKLGGILNQCIHDGFGLHKFREALTGPEYAQRYIDSFNALEIESMLETIVVSMSSDRVLCVSSAKGFVKIQAGTIILAMGCRERTAGAICIPGTRPAGIYTAGAAQNFINLQNIMPGRKAVILGSGDIGLIMARRLTLEGAKVEAVFEILPYASGLQRNIQQCLNDYGIPLYLGTSVVNIHGKDRITGVTVAQFSADRRPVKGNERHIECDTLLLSVGLIPENELSREAGIYLETKTNGALVDDSLMTSIPGIFSCGNVLHVHDVVDFVSDEAAKTGQNAAAYLRGELKLNDSFVDIKPGKGVGYVLPQKVSGKNDFTLSLRVTEPAGDKSLILQDGEKTLIQKKMIRLHPAEMIRIPVKTELLSGISSLEVCVE